MGDTYEWRTWASTDPTPSYSATLYLNDGALYDHATNARFPSTPDVRLSAGLDFSQHYEARITLSPPAKATAVIFTTLIGKDVVPFGIFGWSWTAYGTPFGGVEAQLSAGPGANDTFFEQTVQIASGVYYGSLRLFASINKTGAFVNVNLYDFRQPSASLATLASLAATGTLLFGGVAAATASTAATATAATAVVLCDPYSYSQPCAGNVFALAAGPTCPPYAYDNGRQEGCDCPTAT